MLQVKGDFHFAVSDPFNANEVLYLLTLGP